MKKSDKIKSKNKSKNKKNIKESKSVKQISKKYAKKNSKKPSISQKTAKSKKPKLKAKLSYSSTNQAFSRSDHSQDNIQDSLNAFNELNSHDIITSSAVRIKKLEEISKKKSQEYSTYEMINFWIFLITSLIGNFFFSLIIVFLIVFLLDPLLYVIVIILGLGAGSVYSYLIHHLKNSYLHQHIYAKMFILVTGAVNVAYIVILSNRLFSLYGFIEQTYNPTGIAITFFICYLLPYFIELLIKSNP